jgi:hypothetical protein
MNIELGSVFGSGRGRGRGQGQPAGKRGKEERRNIIISRILPCVCVFALCKINLSCVGI